LERASASSTTQQHNNNPAALSGSCSRVNSPTNLSSCQGYSCEDPRKTTTRICRSRPETAPGGTANQQWRCTEFVLWEEECKCSCPVQQCKVELGSDLVRKKRAVQLQYPNGNADQGSFTQAVRSLWSWTSQGCSRHLLSYCTLLKYYPETPDGGQQVRQ